MGTPGDEAAEHDLDKPFAGGLFPNRWGICSGDEERSAETIRTDVPQDGEYHWYRIGAWESRPSSFLWGFHWRQRVDVSQV